MHRNLRRAAALLVLASLSGCATFQPTPQATAAWKQHQRSVAELESFTLLGRFAAGGVFGTKGNVRWQQDGDQYRLRLWGPFGAGAVQITGNTQIALVRTPEQTYETTDVERELHRRYGWTLPVRHLRWWVRGIPAPGSSAYVEYDAQGRATLLEQDGWELEYESYAVAGGRSLPRILEMSNDDLGAKLVIDQWLDLP